MLSKELLEYAQIYQSERKEGERSDKYKGTFLPLEILTEKESGKSHLSVSISGTGVVYKSTFITQKASIIRIVRIKFRFFILPTTISKIYLKEHFYASFKDFITEKDVDGEQFWVIPEDKNEAFKEKIKSLDLDNSFNEKYDIEFYQ